MIISHSIKSYFGSDVCYNVDRSLFIWHCWSVIKTSLTSKSEWTLDNIAIEKIISAPILAKRFFLEVSALVAVRRHCPKLQSWAISVKTNNGTLRKWQKPYPNFELNLGLPKFLSRVLSRQCSKLSSYTISSETNELNLKK